ncbi:MAG: hypothetical protein M3352_08585 [Bacteroidota bacterium]|nr:hypothetical protein [Bacteroidota bacterium]
MRYPLKKEIIKLPIQYNNKTFVPTFVTDDRWQMTASRSIMIGILSYKARVVGDE